MSYELNKNKRKKLIYLYKQFLDDPEKVYIKTSSEYFVSPATHLYTKVVQSAMIGAIEMFQKKLSKIDAKKVLTDLLKEEKEEEEFKKIEGN